ncbi:MAG: DUF2752 domain-containing protein [Lachnospiraceae bacterium]|nr:DUF2752 domain-containing protein [Lachnospiraceae bacterium]
MLTSGIVYMSLLLCTDLYIQCPFFLITGYQCPGCGITRMIISIIRFEFENAYHYNKFLFSTIPLIIFLMVTRRSEKRSVKMIRILYMIGLVIWGILRNL